MLDRPKRNSWESQLIDAFFVPILLTGLSGSVIVKERSRVKGQSWKQNTWRQPYSLPVESAKALLLDSIGQKGITIRVLYSSNPYNLRISSKIENTEFHYYLALKQSLVALYCVASFDAFDPAFLFNGFDWSDFQIQELEEFGKQLAQYDLSHLDFYQETSYHKAREVIVSLVKRQANAQI